MTEYRAYIVGLDGELLRAIQLICADESAKDYARQPLTGTTKNSGTATAELRV
jgi:hypothetical protein